MNLSVDELRKRFEKYMGLLSNDYDMLDKLSNDINLMEDEIDHMKESRLRVGELDRSIVSLRNQISELSSYGDTVSTIKNQRSELMNKYSKLNEERKSLLQKHGVKYLADFELKIEESKKKIDAMNIESEQVKLSKDNSRKFIEKIVEILNEKKEGLSSDIASIILDASKGFNEYLATSKIMEKYRKHKLDLESKLKEYELYGDLLTEKDFDEIDKIKQDIEILDVQLTSDVDSKGIITYAGAWKSSSDKLENISRKSKSLESEFNSVSSLLNDINDSLTLVVPKDEPFNFNQKPVPDVVEPDVVPQNNGSVVEPNVAPQSNGGAVEPDFSFAPETTRFLVPSTSDLGTIIDANDDMPTYILSNIDSSNNSDAFVDDIFYNEIADFVANCETISIPTLQKQFGLEYKEALYYIDLLEENGIIESFNGNAVRKVLNNSGKNLPNNGDTFVDDIPSFDIDLSSFDNDINIDVSIPKTKKIRGDVDLSSYEFLNNDNFNVNNTIPDNMLHDLVFDKSNPEVDFSREQRKSNYFNSIRKLRNEAVIKAKKKRKVDSSKKTIHLEKVKSFLKKFNRYNQAVNSGEEIKGRTK